MTMEAFYSTVQELQSSELSTVFRPPKTAWGYISEVFEPRGLALAASTSGHKRTNPLCKFSEKSEMVECKALVDLS